MNGCLVYRRVPWLDAHFDHRHPGESQEGNTRMLMISTIIFWRKEYGRLLEMPRLRRTIEYGRVL